MVKNHLGNDVCAYAGMKGKVIDLDHENSFVLDCNTSTFIVPSRNAYKQNEKGCWVIIDGQEIFINLYIKKNLMYLQKFLIFLSYENDSRRKISIILNYI